MIQSIPLCTLVTMTLLFLVLLNASIASSNVSGNICFPVSFSLSLFFLTLCCITDLKDSSHCAVSVS